MSTPNDGGNASLWVSCYAQTPPDGVAVHTKIDDERGCRNEAVLKRHGRLWFLEDGSMYVYYEPTHWAPMPPNGAGELRLPDRDARKETK